MNTALSFEVYRGIWLIEGSEDSLRNIWRDAKTSVYDPNEKLNTLSFYDIATGITVPATPSSADSKADKKIAVTDIKGVITKSGGASSRGMEQLSTDMIKADNDPDVIGHFVRVDSPGGSAVAMDYMKQTMQGLKKPKVTMVTRQGMAASGGLGILVEGDYVMAESGDAQIGSHGVMWGTSGVPNGQKDGNGEVNFVVIASSSPDKNKAPLQAINNNDTSLMQAEVDKLHTKFKASTVALRPNAKDEHMTGGMFPASELVGTMIDAIGTQSEGLNKILELSNTKTTFNENLNNNQTKAMTADEIKAKFPDTHTAIYNAGVSAGHQSGVEAEQERVKSWQVYAAVDPEAVNKGIASGKAITQSETHAFLLKATSKNTLESLKEGGPAAVATPAATTQEEAPEVAAKKKEESDLFALANFNKN